MLTFSSYKSSPKYCRERVGAKRNPTERKRMTLCDDCWVILQDSSVQRRQSCWHPLENREGGRKGEREKEGKGGRGRETDRQT